MAVAIGDVLLCSYRSVWQAQRILFTQTYRVETVGTTDDPTIFAQNILDTWADALDGAMVFKYAVCLGTDVVIETGRVQLIKPARFAFQERNINLNGTGAATAPTGNIAGVFTFRTIYAARDQVANKHIGPMPTGAYVDGSLSAGQLAKLSDLATQILTPITVLATGAVVKPCILHQATGATNLITNFSVSSRVGTMRRRTLRVGE